MSSSSTCAQIGGVSLRYSHESQAYVIDGRMKTGEGTKSKARNTIRSHYRWVRQDINNPEVDKHANFADQPIQQARREIHPKWKHRRRKKLRKKFAVISTSNLAVEQNTFPADLFHEDSSNQPTTSMRFDEEMKTRAANELKEEIISAQSSKDSYSEESSTSSIPPPTTTQESQPQLQQSFSDESSLTDDSPTCITADISHYKRSDNKDFVRIQNISKKGITQKNERNKGRVTWWDDRCNRYKPFLLKIDVLMVDNSAPFDLMERGIVGLPSNAYITRDREAEALSFDLNDHGSITSSYTCSAPKYFTGEFWMDKSEKLKMQGCRVCKKVDDAIDKVKVMAIDLSESIGEVSCGMDKKEISECIDCTSPRIFRTNARKEKRGERILRRKVMDVPVTEVIIK